MKTNNGWTVAGTLLLAALLVAPAAAQDQNFAKLVGDVKFGEAKKGDVLQVPFLTWGGDVAGFHANGDALETKPGSIFAGLGLKVKFTNGDDFVAQVKDYVTGKTPYLRGTFSQLGQACEVLNLDPKCKPIVFLQLTWSAGDHMVGRPSVQNLNNLKGKKIALQSGGPHVGMLGDVLHTAGLTWKDIKIEWVKDLTGKEGVAEKFKKDESIDACFVISPDMQGLTGGLDKVGTGAEGSIKGASVLISTVTMKRSIADVYAVRKDYYEANKEEVQKFAAGYLKGSEALLEAKAKFNKDAKATETYKAILKFTQDTFKEAVPNEAEADGFVSDALFVGLPGNRAFFQEKGNLSGFQAKMDAAIKSAVDAGFAAKAADFLPVEFDADGLPGLVKGGLKKEGRSSIAEGAEPEKLIFTFKITFDVNKFEFPEEDYGKDFKRAVELASLYGNAVVTVRGHVDPNRCLQVFEEAAVAKKIITREGGTGPYTYVKDGTKIDLDNPKDIKKIVDIIRKEDFGGATTNPQLILQACDKLSQDRANKVSDAVLGYARKHNFKVDGKQLKPVGLSIAEPVVPRPKNVPDAASNRRVEFSIYSIKSKGATAEGAEYDY